MSFSGLRGGIAFSLMSLSNIDLVNKDAKEFFILTTIFIVFFTSFIQGTLCGPLVNLFGIDKASDPEDDEYKVSTQMHTKVISYFTDGVSTIIGDIGITQFSGVNKFELMMQKTVNPWLLKDSTNAEGDLNFNELAEVWQKEIQADIDSFSKQATAGTSIEGQTKARGAKRRQSINRDVLISQLRNSLNIADGSIIPDQNIRAVRFGQTGVTDQLKRQTQFRQIREEAARRIKEEQRLASSGEVKRNRRKSIFNLMTGSSPKNDRRFGQIDGQNFQMDQSTTSRKSKVKNFKRRVSLAIGLQAQNEDMLSSSDITRSRNETALSSATNLGFNENEDRKAIIIPEKVTPAKTSYTIALNDADSDADEL